MHILFIHKNFPAQFRHIMPYFVESMGAECTFVTEKGAATLSPQVRRLQYKPRFQASKFSSYCGRSFETQMWRSQAIVEALAAEPELKPDLIVAHSGFFTTSFLRELYDCPIINLFEYYYHSTESDYDFRADLFDPSMIERIRARARNSVFLLDLENCTRGYCPTQWQRSRFPSEFRTKLDVAHDGVDTTYWTPGVSEARGERQAGERHALGIPPDIKVVTYVSRGFESMRGFDIFMRFAKRICDLRDDVIFLVAGSDRVSYGADRQITGGKSFKEWVLMQDDYDLDRIRFLGFTDQDTLRSMYRTSDLHVYLTAPFVISWSPLDAMSTECLVMGSRTQPVQEVIEHGHNGLLVDFFDVDHMVAQATQVFDQPDRFYGMRKQARQTIKSSFGLDVAMPKLADVFMNLAAA